MGAVVMDRTNTWKYLYSANSVFPGVPEFVATRHSAHEDALLISDETDYFMKYIPWLPITSSEPGSVFYREMGKHLNLDPSPDSTPDMQIMFDAYTTEGMLKFLKNASEELRERVKHIIIHKTTFFDEIDTLKYYVSPNVITIENITWEETQILDFISGFSDTTVDLGIQSMHSNLSHSLFSCLPNLTRLRYSSSRTSPDTELIAICKNSQKLTHLIYDSSFILPNSLLTALSMRNSNLWQYLQLGTVNMFHPDVVDINDIMKFTNALYLQIYGDTKLLYQPISKNIRPGSHIGIIWCATSRVERYAGYDDTEYFGPSLATNNDASSPMNSDCSHIAQLVIVPYYENGYYLDTNQIGLFSGHVDVEYLQYYYTPEMFRRRFAT